MLKGKSFVALRPCLHNGKFKDLLFHRLCTVVSLELEK